MPEADAPQAQIRLRRKSPVFSAGSCQKPKKIEKTEGLYHGKKLLSSKYPNTTQHLLPEVLWAAEYIFGTQRG